MGSFETVHAGQTTGTLVMFDRPWESRRLTPTFKGTVWTVLELTP
jgi:hypothetical protein